MSARISLFILDFVGSSVRVLWLAACTAILYFFGAACFYNGTWEHVAEAAFAAAVLYLVTEGFEGWAQKLATKAQSKKIHPLAGPHSFSGMR
jgi:hypothetical protein